MQIGILASVLLIGLSTTCLAAEGVAGPGSGQAVPAARDCVDAAAHTALWGEDPSVWRECRAVDEFGRCPGDRDPTCFNAANKQTRCINPVVRVKAR